MKRILVIGTGGTLVSRPGGQGLIPEISVSKLLTYVPKAKQLCQLEQIQLFNLDSTNIRPENWLQLARCIRENYDKYDGFLVLHGTDTMAYTAAALSYLLQNSPKPIVLTGSQKPMEAEGTDARENIYQSILYAVSSQASDVNIVFSGRVIPGGRARKIRSRSRDAFACVDCPDRAEIREDQIVQNLEYVQSEPFCSYDKLESKVIDLKLTPGMNPGSLLCLAADYEGFVLEGFGLGGLPDSKEIDFFPFVRELLHLGKTVAVTTQVPMEGTDMSVYEVGKRFKDGLDILEGGTMTPEAITVKLMWVLARTTDPEKIKEWFYQPINYDRI